MTTPGTGPAAVSAPVKASVPIRRRPRATLSAVLAAVPRRLRYAWVVVALASLWLRTGFPIHAIGESGLDDALFVRLARYMGAGLWLGPLDFVTHVKGPFYPMFILASFAAGIPLKLAEQAVWLLASAAAALLLARRGRPGLATLLFAALAFNPALWTPDLSRVIREGIYLSLSLALVAATVAALFPRRALFAGAVGRGLLLGLLGGAFALTREEGVWILPALGTVVALALLGRTVPWRAAVPSLLAAVLAFGTAVGAVMALNQRVYGLPYTVDVNSSAFRHAYGALVRIGNEPWRRYVAVPRSSLLLAYQVSAAAKELQPFLEGEQGDYWRRIACEAEGGTDCTEILASWFQWALKQAVKSAGHYNSLPETDRFYARMAAEIDAACDRGEMPCRPPRATLLPLFRAQDVTDALHRAATLLPELLAMGGRDVRTEHSVGPEYGIDQFEDTVGPVGRQAEPLVVMRGFVSSPAGPVQLALRAPPGLSPRTDLVVEAPKPASGPGGASQWFDLGTTCPVDRCELVAFPPGGEPIALPLSDLVPGSRIERPGLVLTPSFVRDGITHRASVQRSAAMVRLARPLARLYALAMPVLAAAGLLGTLAALVLRPRAAVRDPLFALAAAAAAAIATRVALISYLDVTSIRSAGILYLSPATPFVVLLAVTGLALGAGLVRRASPLSRPPVPRMAPADPETP